MTIGPHVFAETLRALLGPVDEVMADESVTQVLINAFDEVYVERDGSLTRTDARFESRADLDALLTNVAQSAGVDISPESPLLSVALPDGAVLQAVVPPIAKDSPHVSIRCAERSLGLESFVTGGAEPQEMLTLLRGISEVHTNVLLCGDHHGGKAALLHTLVSRIPPVDRIIAIDLRQKLARRNQHILQFSTSGAAAGCGLNARDLLQVARAMRPDRIVLGEIRGAEAYDLVRAMSSRGMSCLSTLDAPSARDALCLLEGMAATGRPELPRRVLRRWIVSALDLVICVRRTALGCGQVAEILGVCDWTSGDGYLLRAASKNGATC